MADGSRSSSLPSPTQGVTPTWVRWVMPSVADLVFVAVLGALAFTALSVRLLGDAGIGWHIRTGQQILAMQAIPRVDSFSSTMAGRPWFAWEWPYDVIVGWLDAAAGLNGVVWLTAAMIAATFALMFRRLIASGTHLLTAVVLVLLAMSASTIHFLARPHVVSWLLTLAWYSILESTERETRDGGGPSRRLWVLPVSMLLWVNLHGGFLLGFALLGIFWLGSLWTWMRLRHARIEESLQKIAEARRVRLLSGVALASAVATLANPYGWKLHEHIYSYLTDRFLMDHIEEFQSPNFHGLAERCFLVLLLVAIAVLAVRGRELRMSAVLLALFAVYAGLNASRNIPVSAMLLVLIVGPLLPLAGRPEGFFARMAAVELKSRGHLWPVLAVLLTLLVALGGGKAGSRQLMDAHFDSTRMPVGAVTFLGTRDGSRPILTPDYWGGYVIYRLYPEKQAVVVDDRHDLYGADFLKSYLNMVHVEPGWDEFLRQRDPTTVLLPRHSALANRLSVTTAWRPIYADEMAIVFARDPAKADASSPTLGHMN